MKILILTVLFSGIMLVTQAGAGNTRRVLPLSPRMEVVSVMAESTITQKKCNRCGETKPHDAFYQRTDGGPRSKCRECFKAERQPHSEKTPEQKEASRASVRRYYNRNKDKFKEKASKYYQENTDALKSYARKWQEENREHYRDLCRKRRKERPAKPLTPEQREKYGEHRRAWRATNRERENERFREWSKANPNVRLAANHRRRAKCKGNGGTFAPREWSEMKRHFDYTCLCCKRREPEVKLTVDHIIPISQGGLNVAANIQPLCGSCNSSKWAREIDYRPMFEMKNNQVEQGT